MSSQITPTVKIDVQGARGESQADILRRTGRYGVLPTDTDDQAMAKLNAVAEKANADAQSARDGAIAASNYRPTLTQGIADFSVGEFFTSDDQDSEGDNPLVLRTYKRIASSPYYEDMGDSAAPVSNKDINTIVSGVPYNVDFANIPHDASTPDGTGTSAVSGLNALGVGGYIALGFPPHYFASDQSTGGMLLTGNINVPADQIWEGARHFSKFVIDENDPNEGRAYIRFSVNSSSQAAESYNSYKRGKRFKGFYVDGRAAKANGKTPVGLMIGCPAFEVSDSYFYGLSTSIRNALAGTTGEASHADHLRIRNNHFGNQASGTDLDVTNPNSAKYQISWIQDTPGADGALIEGNQATSFFEAPGDASTEKRQRFIALRNFTLVKIRQNINGDIVLWNCTGEIDAHYAESGQIRLIESQVDVRNCLFWQRSSAESADMGVVPLRIEKGVFSSSASPSYTLIDNTVWDYDASQAIGGYPTEAHHNFEIEDIYANVDIRRSFRLAPFTNSKTQVMRVGLQCGMPEFDRYSHFASIESSYRGSPFLSSGTEKTYRWEINAKRGPLLSNNAASGVILDSDFGVSPGGTLKFSGDSGDYVYTAVAFHDAIRRVGVIGTESERTITGVTNGGRAPYLRLSTRLSSNCVVLVARRKSTSTDFTHFAWVYGCEMTYMYDDGAAINSFPWEEFSTAQTLTQIRAMVNAGTGGAYTLQPGDQSSASDAYGNVAVTSLTGVLPTVGGWRKGDRILLSTPTRWKANGMDMFLMGYTRMTDCTSAATSNLATDWRADYQVIGVSDCGTLANDADETLTFGTSSSINRFTATLTANRTITLATSGVPDGAWFEVYRSGGGAFDLSVGGLKNLAQNTGCKVIYDAGAWRLIA